MNRSSSGRAAGARVSGVTAGRSRGSASRWTSARSGLEFINTRPSTIAAAIRFCVFTTGLQRRAHSTFSITSSRSCHSRFNASRPTVAASSLQRPFNSASWTGPSNSGPLHHDRRISTARSSAPIVPIGRNSGTQSIHGLQTSRGSWPSGSITGTGIGPIRRWRPFTHRPGLRTNRQDAPLGNRRGCIRPHTRAHQDRRLSPRQSSR